MEEEGWGLDWHAAEMFWLQEGVPLESDLMRNKTSDIFCLQEEASVRASAIEHLGLLRGWARDQRLPITTTEKEAIHELVVVLIHLEDEDLEVAKVRAKEVDLCSRREGLFSGASETMSRNL